MTDPTIINRNLSELAPAFRAAVEAALAECHARGLDAFVFEARRTNERQAWLYQQGRTRGGVIVTQAQSSLYSWHGYGLAVDVISRSKEWDAPESWWDAVAAIFERHGCTAGRRWKSPDSPHMQFGKCRVSPSDRARELYRLYGLPAVWREVGAMEAPAPKPASKVVAGPLKASTLMALGSEQGPIIAGTLRPEKIPPPFSGRITVGEPDTLKLPSAMQKLEATPVLVTPKPALRSRTIWLNGITAVVSAAAIAGDALNLAQQTGIHVPEDIAKYVLLGVGVVNIYLRRKTSAPLEGTSAAS
jgi:hypothetical protein